MAALTPEDISQILEEFFKTVGTRQYIGARYIPIFGRRGEDSIQWDNSAPYEPLTIVQYQGNSYTSRQFVPIGVDITNQTYWASTGIYNSQVEQYRQEVLQFDGRITATEDAITALDASLPIGDYSSSNTVSDAIAANAADISALADIIPASAYSSSSTVQNAIGALDARLDSLEAKRHMVIFGDSWADYNVTVNQQYLNYLARDLNVTVHNYAVNGARYTGSTNLVSTQVTNFINDTSFDHAHVLYVYMTGGVNDQNLYNVTAGELQTAIREQIRRVQAEVPHAKILYMSDFAYPYTTEGMTYWKTVHGMLQSYHAIKLVNPYGLFSPNLLNQTNWMHLTQAGYEVWGQMVRSALDGGMIEPNLQMHGTRSEDGFKLTWDVLPVPGVGAVGKIVAHFPAYTGTGTTQSHTFTLDGIAQYIPWYVAHDGFLPAMGTHWSTAIMGHPSNGSIQISRLMPAANAYDAFDYIFTFVA